MRPWVLRRICNARIHAGAASDSEMTSSVLPNMVRVDGFPYRMGRAIDRATVVAHGGVGKENHGRIISNFSPYMEWHVRISGTSAPLNTGQGGFPQRKGPTTRYPTKPAIHLKTTTHKWTYENPNCRRTLLNT